LNPTSTRIVWSTPLKCSASSAACRERGVGPDSVAAAHRPGCRRSSTASPRANRARVSPASNEIADEIRSACTDPRARQHAARSTGASRSGGHARCLITPAMR
jgi:hypothetical protein